MPWLASERGKLNRIVTVLVSNATASGLRLDTKLHGMKE